MAKAQKVTQNVTTTEGLTTRIINGVKLESIPLPVSGAGAKSKYPFGEMEVGESFEIVGEKNLQNVRNALTKYQSSHDGYKFATRAQGEREENGAKVKVYRCWRIDAPKPTNG